MIMSGEHYNGQTVGSSAISAFAFETVHEIDSIVRSTLYGYDSTIQVLLNLDLFSTSKKYSVLFGTYYLICTRY